MTKQYKRKQIAHLNRLEMDGQRWYRRTASSERVTDAPTERNPNQPRMVANHPDNVDPWTGIVRKRSAPGWYGGSAAGCYGGYAEKEPTMIHLWRI